MNQVLDEIGINLDEQMVAAPGQKAQVSIQHAWPLSWRNASLPCVLVGGHLTSFQAYARLQEKCTFELNVHACSLEDAKHLRCNRSACSSALDTALHMVTMM